MPLDPAILQGITVQAGKELETLWNVLQPKTSDDFIQQVQALIAKWGTISAALSGEAYLEARLAAGVAGKFTPDLADPINLDQASTSLLWAAAPLREKDTSAAFKRVMSVTTRLAVAPARETTFRSIDKDPKASGYARVASPGSCAFCGMLGSRGAVYKTEAKASSRKSDGKAFHDHCNCRIEELFGDSEPNYSEDERKYVDRMDELYRKATQRTSGKDSVRAFARAVYADRVSETPSTI